MNFNRIISDWSWRLNDGIPNVSDKSKLIVLSECLRYEGWSQEVIDTFISTLLEREVSDDELIKYTDKQGNPAEMKAGSAKKQPSGHPAKIEYDRLVGDDEEEEPKDKADDTAADKADKPEVDDKARERAEEKAEEEAKVQAQADVQNTPEPGSDNADAVKAGEVDDALFDSETESDNIVKDDMLKYGFSGYEKQTGSRPAPGTAGSAFNEIMSGRGVEMLEADPTMSEEQLARQIYEQTKNTALGKEQSRSSGVGKIPSDIDNANLWSKSVISARSAKTKYDQTQERIKNLQSAGEFGSNYTIQSYYGANVSTQAQVNAVNNANKILLPDGTEVLKEDAVEFIKAGGGGMNPSDTATFAKDENGNLLLQFHSDKTSTNDIQDNSTLAQEGENYKNNVNEIDSLSESQKRVANNTIQEYSDKISKIEDNYNNQAIPIAGRLGDLPIQQQLDIIENDKGTLKKNINVAIYGDAAVKRGDFSKLSKVIQQYLPTGKSPEELTIEDKYTMVRKIVADGRGSGSHVKVVNKVGLGLQKADPSIEGIDVKKNLSEQREIVVSLQKERIEKLDEQTTVDVSGVEVPLGRLVESEETIRGFHLNLMNYPPSKYEQGNPSTIMGSALDINMGGTLVNSDVLRSCIGVDNTTEFKQKFKLKESEELMKDDQGNVTGKTVFVYAVDTEGKEIEVGQKTYRSKSGATGRTQNTFKYSSGMQQCFKSK